MTMGTLDLSFQIQSFGTSCKLRQVSSRWQDSHWKANGRMYHLMARYAKDVIRDPPPKLPLWVQKYFHHFDRRYEFVLYCVVHHPDLPNLNFKGLSRSSAVDCALAACLTGRIELLRVFHDNVALNAEDFRGRLRFTDVKLEILKYLHECLGLTAEDFENVQAHNLRLVHYACERAMMDVLTFLKDIGVDVHKPGFFGSTAIHHACEGGHPTVLHFLESVGACFETRNALGSTGVHYASMKGHVEVLEFLRVRGVDLALPNKFGMTAAHYACERGFSHVLEYLHSVGVPLDESGNDGRLPMHLASMGGHVRPLETLQGLGYGLDTADRAGKTCAHYAAERGHLPVLEFLVKAIRESTGCKDGGVAAFLAREDDWKKTAAVYARECGHWRAGAYLNLFGGTADASPELKARVLAIFLPHNAVQVVASERLKEKQTSGSGH